MLSMKTLGNFYRLRRSSIIVACFMLSLSAFSVAAHAGGGIYFDDLAITNNGSTVLSDNFDDGNISDWSGRYWATLSSDHSHSAFSSLYLNWHGPTVAEAFHTISITNPGIVSYSAWVYLPPVSAQYNWSHSGTSFTNLYLYSSSDNIWTGIELRPNESGYRVCMNWNNGSGGTGATSHTGVVLQPNTWALLTLQMDQSTGIASSMLNGQSLLNYTYNPQHFQTFNNASVWGWLGDGPLPVPEPSSILTLLCGISTLGGLVLRRSRG